MALTSTFKQTVKRVIPRSVAIYELPNSRSRTLLLTFDDGPDPELTPRILDQLDALNAKAIFFVVGQRIAGNEAILRDMQRRGHRIANHSFSHQLSAAQSLRAIHDDLALCQRTIFDATGDAPRFFRPPCGMLSAKIWLAARMLDLTIVQWSNEGGEWGRHQDEAATQISKRLALTIRPQQIVLLHDDSRKVLDVLSDRAISRTLSSYTIGYEALAALQAVRSRLDVMNFLLSAPRFSGILL